MSIHIPDRPDLKVGSLLSSTHKTELASKVKGKRKRKYEQRVVHLLPHRDSIRYAQQLGVDTTGWHNLCRGSTRGCRSVCLTNSGRMPMNHLPQFVRSYLWQAHRNLFLARLDDEITTFANGCRNRRSQPVIRLYGTHDGDILADAPGIVDAHPDVMFSDYTKLPIATGEVRENVYRIRSATELTTREEFLDHAARGLNHAVPFMLRRTDPLPEFYYGIPVIDGDLHDLRFTDPDGVIVGLRFKPAAGVRLDDTPQGSACGFVRNPVTPVAVSV